MLASCLQDHVHASDPFSAAFGAGRGPLREDTLLARRPTERARQALAHALENTPWEEVLQTLEHHRSIITERPLLLSLVDGAARESVESRFILRHQTMLTLLHALGIAASERVRGPHEALREVRRLALQEAGSIADKALRARRTPLKNSMEAAALKVVDQQFLSFVGHMLHESAASSTLSLLVCEAASQMPGQRQQSYEELLPLVSKLGLADCLSLIKTGYEELLRSGCVQAGAALGEIALPLAKEIQRLSGSAPTLTEPRLAT